MSTDKAGNGAAIGGWICFALGMGVMVWSLWIFLVYGPLFLVSFVLAIVCLAQKRLAHGLSMLLLTLIVPATTFVLLGTFRADAALKEINASMPKPVAPPTAQAKAVTPAPAASPATAPAPGPNDDPLLYLAAEKVELYDFKAKYFQSALDGRIPGVEFKLRNKGERTLSRVRVVVYFKGKDGATIAEESFLPVAAGGFMDGAPLKPGYIWQQERGKFFAAKNVPSEWVEGAAYATITEVAFQ